jgi:phage tail-like protein
VRSEEIARLLPDVFQAALQPFETAGLVEPDRRLAAVLSAMEVLHAPTESVIDGLASYVDPRLTPTRFVPYLAGWVDLDWLLVADPDDTSIASRILPTGAGRSRELVAASTQLASWRGTAYGLRRFLITATGLDGWAIDENVTGEERTPKPFHLRIVAPAEAEEYRPLIERIIVAEKPAAVTWELVFAPTGTPSGAPLANLTTTTED